MKKSLLVGFIVMVSAMASQAAERFPIRFGGTQMQGQSKIMLKQELNRSYNINLSQYEIERVVLVAKSKAGRGTAALFVGGQSTYDQIIDGRPRDFQTEDQRTYSRLEFTAPRRANENGAWQLHLQGNIKVKRVVVFLEKKRMRPDPRPFPPRPGRVVFQPAGEERFEKFFTETERYDVGKSGVTAIRITAKSNSAAVQSVLVRFGNGEVMEAYELEGFIGENNTKTMFISNQGRNVNSVSITASSGLIGSRVKIALEAGVETGGGRGRH